MENQQHQLFQILLDIYYIDVMQNLRSPGASSVLLSFFFPFMSTNLENLSSTRFLALWSVWPTLLRSNDEY